MHVDVTPSRIAPIFLAFALAACATHLQVRPDMPEAGAKLPLKVALVVPWQLAENVDDLGKFDQISGSFKVDTGTRVLPAVKAVLNSVFESVEQVPDVDHAGSAEVVCVLKQLRLFHPSMRPADYELRFDLRVQCKKPDGTPIIDASYAEFLKAVPGKQPGEAVQTPIEQTMSAVLARLAGDLRTSLGAPAVAVAVAAVADAGVEPVVVATSDGGTDQQMAAVAPPPPPPPPRPRQVVPATDFPEFPPPPPPPGSTDADGGTELVVAAPIADAGTAVVAAAAPVDAGIAAVASSSASVPLEVSKPAAKRGPNGVLMALGLVLFAGGYATPPMVMNVLNLPGGTSNHAWIPFAGALLASTQNPFLSQDQFALALTIAGTAAQGLGAILAIIGAASGGGGGEAPKHASLMLEGDGWALLPGVGPTGICVTLRH